MSILLCFSGGLDSVTLAAMQRDSGFDVHCLFIDRGQTNAAREREAVKYFESMPWVKSLSETRLVDWSRSWKKPDSVTDKELPRNALFVLAALPFAHELRVDSIALGCNMDDTTVPDGSLAFIQAMNSLLDATKQPVNLVAPFLDKGMAKVDVAKAALRLLGEEDVAQTWSCWQAGKTPCMSCSACRSREVALDEARQQR